MPEPVMVKGKAEPVPIFRPSKFEKKSLLWDKLKQSFAVPKAIYGRQTEINILSEVLEQGSGVIVIQGEPGIGKSILLDHLQAEANELGRFYMRGGGDALEKDTPFFAWRPIFLQIFGLHKMNRKDKGPQRKQVISVLASEWHEWASVLNNVIGLDFPKTPSVVSLTPEERRDVTIEMLSDILNTVVNDNKQMVLILDNCQVNV